MKGIPTGPAQLGADTSKKRSHLKWLADIIVSAEGKSPAQGFHLIIGGKYNYRHVGVPSDPVEFQAGHKRIMYVYKIITLGLGY